MRSRIKKTEVAALGGNSWFSYAVHIYYGIKNLFTYFFNRAILSKAKYLFSKKLKKNRKNMVLGIIKILSS